MDWDKIRVFHAVAEAGKAGFTGGQCFGVAVQAHQDAVGRCPVEDRFGVSAATEGTVEHRRAGRQVKVFDALVEQDGHVVKVGAHEVGCPPNSPRRRATSEGQRREWGASNHFDNIHSTTSRHLTIAKDTVPHRTLRDH